MFALCWKAKTGKSNNLRICCGYLIPESSGTNEYGEVAAKFSNQLCQPFSDRAKTAMSARYELVIKTIKTVEAMLHEDTDRELWGVREVVRPTIKSFEVWQFPLSCL